MPVNISLDFDGTFTAMPNEWTKAIEIFRAAGANVFCITSRFPNVPITGFPGDVHYTCGQAKWEWAHEHGLKVDIWIDDIPYCIGGPPIVGEPGQAAQRRAIVKQVFDNLKFG